jgi:hypothetical protein
MFDDEREREFKRLRREHDQLTLDKKRLTDENQRLREELRVQQAPATPMVDATERFKKLEID